MSKDSEDFNITIRVFENIEHKTIYHIDYDKR